LIPLSTFAAWLKDEFVVCGAGTRRFARRFFQGRLPEVVVRRIVEYAPPGVTLPGILRLQTAAEAFAIKILLRANAVAAHRGKSCVWPFPDVAVTLATVGLGDLDDADPCCAARHRVISSEPFLFGMRALSRMAGVEYCHPAALFDVAQATRAFCRDVVTVAAGLPNKWDEIDRLLELARQIVFDENDDVVRDDTFTTTTTEAEREEGAAGHQQHHHQMGDDDDDDDDDAMSCSSYTSYDSSSCSSSSEMDCDSGYRTDLSEDDRTLATSSSSRRRRRHLEEQQRLPRDDDEDEEAEVTPEDVDLALRRLGLPIFGTTKDEVDEDRVKKIPRHQPSTWSSSCPGCGRVVVFRSRKGALEKIPTYLRPCAFVDEEIFDDDDDDDDQDDQDEAELSDVVSHDWADLVITGPPRSPGSGTSSRGRTLSTPPSALRATVSEHQIVRECAAAATTTTTPPPQQQQCRRRTPLTRELCERYRPRSFPPEGQQQHRYSSSSSWPELLHATSSSSSSNGNGSSSALRETSLERFVRSAAGGHRPSAFVEDDVVDLVEYWACKLVRTACEYARTRSSFAVEVRDCYATMVRVVDQGHRDDAAEFGRRVRPPVVLADWIPGLRRKWIEGQNEEELFFSPNADVVGDGGIFFDPCSEHRSVVVALADSVTGQVQEAREVLGITASDVAEGLLAEFLEALLRVHFHRVGMLSVHAADALAAYGGDDAGRRTPKKRNQNLLDERHPHPQKKQIGPCLPRRPSGGDDDVKPSSGGRATPRRLNGKKRRLGSGPGRRGRVEDHDGCFGSLLPRDFLLYRQYWLNLSWFDGESMENSSSPFPPNWTL